MYSRMLDARQGTEVGHTDCRDILSLSQSLLVDPEKLSTSDGYPMHADMHITYMIYCDMDYICDVLRQTVVLVLVLFRFVIFNP